MATDTKARGKRTTPPPPKAPIPFYESPKLIAFMKWLIPFVMTGGGSGTAAYFATRHAETQAASRSEIQAMLDKSSAENRSYLTSELSSQNEKLAQRLAPIESNLTLIQKALRDYGTFVGGQGGEMLRDVTTPLKEMRSLSEFAIRSASKKDLPETQGFLAAILPTLKNEHENNTAIAKAAHIFTHNALCSVADDLPATKPLVRTIQTLLITRLKDEGIKAQPFERVVISPEVRSSLPTSIRLGDAVPMGSFISSGSKDNGGTITFDKLIDSGSTYTNTMVFYNGGPTDLQDITFINCKIDDHLAPSSKRQLFESKLIGKAPNLHIDRLVIR